MVHSLPHTTFETKKFERYLTKATRQSVLVPHHSDPVLTCLSFLYNTTSRNVFPDYSTLPVEILQMIAREVAIPNEQECAEFRLGIDTRDRISVHLFKMRLVCRTLCCTATSVFVALTQRDNFSDYKTLYLPPSSGSLARLKKTFTGKDKIIAGLVTKVVYQITAAQSEDTEVDFLREMLYDDIGGCSGGCGPGSRKCVRTIVAKNVQMFGEQYTRDDDFALDLAGPTGRRDLQAILTRLKSLKVVRAEVEDFWGETFDYLLGSPDENHAVGRIPFLHGFPVFVEQLSKSTATDFQLVGLGSHAFSELYPMEVLKLGRKKNFMSNITHFELTASHRDVVQREDWMDEPELGPLRRGDRINILLGCLKNLTSLTIGCRDDYVASSDPHPGDALWLQDILNSQQWPRLRSLTLHTLNFDSGTLHRLLNKHRRIETLVLDKLKHVSSQDWLGLLEHLRRYPALTEASITVLRDLHAHHARLSSIISDYDVAPQTQAWVDIGAYVVEARPEIVELE